MDLIRTEIDKVIILSPQVYKDNRGYFFESFVQKEFEERIAKVHFV